jgi:hypothetical protein
LNTYGYVGANPVNDYDPYGLYSFLVSRPIQNAGGARHMFIVYGADSNGNGGTVRSFGKVSGGPLSSGLMGEVFRDTTGFSAGTLEKDIQYWKNKGPDVSFAMIQATDEQVECAANSLQSNLLYTLPETNNIPWPTSGHLTINSNTAAQAVANYAAGLNMTPPSGWHPGAENYQLIKFKR